MRPWTASLMLALALALTACGGVTSDPDGSGGSDGTGGSSDGTGGSSDDDVTPGSACSEIGATATWGCNTCHCDETGWICGLTGCPPSDEPVPCGGRMGGTCAEDEYCGYEAGSGCGDDDAGSVCKPRPAECPEEHASVCGCDGETYESACLANAAGTGVAIDAPCLPIE